MGFAKKLLRKYQGYWESCATADYWRKVFELLEDCHGGVLLDCGCYNGENTLKVAERIRVNRIYGIDVVDEALERARERGITSIKSNLNEKFPLDSRTVDVVFSNQVIEHLTNTLSFVREIYRVLKPCGYAIVGTENLASWPNILSLLLGWQPFSSKLGIGNPLAFSREEEIRSSFSSNSTICNKWLGYGYGTHNKVLAYRALKEIFEINRFDVVKICGSGYFPFPGIIGVILSNVDPSHAFYIAIKVRKRRF